MQKILSWYGKYREKEGNGWSPWVLQCETHKPRSSNLPRCPSLCSSPAAGLPRRLSEGCTCSTFWTLELFSVFLVDLAQSYLPVELIQSEDQIPALNKQFLAQFNSQQFGRWASRDFLQTLRIKLFPESQSWANLLVTAWPCGLFPRTDLLTLLSSQSYYSKCFPSGLQAQCILAL